MDKPCETLLDLGVSGGGGDYSIGYSFKRLIKCVKPKGHSGDHRGKFLGGGGPVQAKIADAVVQWTVRNR